MAEMRLLVFSDSHGRIGDMIDVVEKLTGQISAVIHLGDNERDAEQLEALYPSIPFYYVPGNCDYCGSHIHRVIELNEKRIFLTHGHKYSVKTNLNKLKQAAAENNADACLFGHTHKAHYEIYSGMLILSPGSICFPHGKHGASYGIVNVPPSGALSGNVVEVAENGGRPIF